MLTWARSCLTAPSQTDGISAPLSWMDVSLALLSKADTSLIAPSKTDLSLAAPSETDSSIQWNASIA